MTLLYIDNATITFANDEVSLDFSTALSIAIDQKVKFEGTFDRISKIVTSTRSANLNEPVMITVVFENQCGGGDGNLSVIDSLHLLYINDMKAGAPRSKGVIKIIDHNSGQTRTYSQAFLANDPEYDARTITRGSQTASYTAEFLCAEEIIN